jgi:hypothetical protein
VGAGNCGTLYRETGDRHGEGQTLNNLGNAYQAMRQSARAVECWREAAAAMRDAGDHEEAARLGQLAANAKLRRRWWRRSRRSAEIWDVAGCLPQSQIALSPEASDSSSWMLARW